MPLEMRFIIHSFFSCVFLLLTKEYLEYMSESMFFGSIGAGFRIPEIP